MKKKKQSDLTSLTARQRKSREQAAEAQETEQTVAEDTQKPDDGDALILGMKKKNFLLLAVAVMVAVLMLIIAIEWPLLFEPYGEYEHPVAVITVKNGSERIELEYALFENSSPKSVVNFIYLARLGYFDGVIIHDVQHGYMKFGGFTDDTFSHRSEEVSFLSKIKDLTVPADKLSTSKNALYYRINTSETAKDTLGNTVRYYNAGALSYLRDGGSGEFQIAGMDALNGTVTYRNKNGELTYSTSNINTIGMPLNTKTKDAVASLYAPIFAGGDNESSKENWREPSKQRGYWLPQQNIVIESVKIHNVNKKFWRNFNYDEYIGTQTYIYWQSKASNKTA